jgi:hypothetical protein
VEGCHTGPDLGPINPQEFQGLGLDDVEATASVHEDLGESNCRRFETGGSLSRRVKCRRVPQPKWVDARPSAKGGKRGGRRWARERWKSRDLRVRPAPRSGALAVGGYKRPHGGRSERPYASASLVLVPERPTPSKRALALPFIGVRRGSRCTMGGVAECYVSSGGELAP